MRMVLFVLLGCVLVVATALLPRLADWKGGNVSAGGDVKPDEEGLKWAREVADLFLKHTIGMEPKFHPEGLLSPGMARSLGNWRSADWFRSVRWYDNAEIVSEKASPDGFEVVFAGVLKYKGNDWRADDADFVLRVAREGGGPWCVRFAEVKPRPEKKG